MSNGSTIGICIRGKVVRRKILVGIAIIVLVFLIIGLYNGLEVTTYVIHSPKVEQAFRIVLVTDKHSCNYGENAQKLIDTIENQHPDLVLLGGDIFDDDLPDNNAVALLKSIGEHFACYYVTGNHEYWRDREAFEACIRLVCENHVIWLNNKSVTLPNIGINLCGINDPDSGRSDNHSEFEASLENVAQTAANGNFTILLSHRPERFEDYCRYPFDLVLAGHAHGGQWRLPFVRSGLFAPNQGLFPKYTCGIYRQGETQMIVSRGLAKESTRIPRFFNRPELVVIDIVPQ